MIKILKNYFTDNNENKGWLPVKGTTLGHDKQKHVVLGVLAFIVAYFVLKDAVYSITDTYELRLTALENAFGITCAVAVAKEIYDAVLFFILKKKANFAPIPDILATVFVPLVVILISKLF